MRRLWSRGAKPEMTMLKIETGIDEAIGKFDHPTDGALLERAATTFNGWVLFPADPAARVDLWLGEHSLGRARLGLPRPDVYASTGIQLGATAGFDLTTDLARWEGDDGNAVLRAVATSASGERFEMPPAQVVLEPLTEKPSDRPPLPAPKTRHSSLTGERSVLVCTHQLDLGGAQFYLLDLLSELLKLGAINPTVVSAIDGPLRETLEDLGVPVHISSLVPLDDASSHVGRIEELVSWTADRDFEVAFVNTATALAFPGAEAAALLGIPAVWAIHESFEPALLWSNLDPEVRRRAEGALGEAAMVIFEAEATERLFESKIAPGHCVTLPYGLDFEPIDAKRAGFERSAAREDAGIPADAEVLLCVGTVEPRKAQVPLAQAFDLIADRHPHARLAFVGGRDDAHSRLLAECIEACKAADRIDLIPITPNVQEWYGVSDVLVCASDIESLPRTVLEAMAWETPVLATNVFGLPELIEEGETGWLCEPRDIAALADALDRALTSTPLERERIGRASRALVERRHSLPNYAREVANLLDLAVRGNTAQPPPHVATS